VTRSEGMQLLVRHLRRVERNYGLQGWHNGREMPALYVLDGCGTHRLPLSRLAWGDLGRESPGHTLLRLARVIEVAPESLRLPLVSDDWYGVGYAMEAWAVEGQGRDPELESMMYARQLHRHPRRVSIRTAQGVTVTQDRATVIRREDRLEKLKVWTSDDSDSPRQTGLIWDGLTALVGALDAIAMVKAEG